MSNTAYQLQYRQEFVAAFEQRVSLLRQSVTTESVIKGNQAVFLVAGSDNQTAVTRGVDGMIPAFSNDLTQNTATLQEWHALYRMTGFNIFASQGNQRQIMQMNSMAVINRKIDSDIFTALNTGTVNTGAAVPASLQMVLKAKTILGNNAVPFDGNITGLITPAFEGYLLETTEFGNNLYTSNMPLQTASEAWQDKPKVYQWLGVNWIVSPNLPGIGTSAEKCFMYHKSSIGHAVNTGEMQSLVGYFEEQDYSWARSTVFMGSKVLQNSGIVVMNHDGSAFAPA